MALTMTSTDPNVTTARELLRQAATTDFEIVAVTEGDLAPGGSMDIVLRFDEDDVETSAFGIIFAIGVLSFHDARPAGASEMHFEADDEWTVGDMVQNLAFERGRLHFYADYVRGRLMKTTVDVHRDGTVTIQTVNRGGSARRWLDMLRCRSVGGPVSLVAQEAPAPFTSKDGKPLRTREDWQALQPALHWKPGRSAVRLAETWGGADGFPAEVKDALDRAERLRGLTFVKGVVEHETPMPGKGKASVTDLMVWADDAVGNPVIIGVEGKVDEGFGPQGLAYQLLHRAYAALLSAQDERAKRAVLLVHSFLEGAGERGSGWKEFVAFVAVLGVEVDVQPGVPVEAGVWDGVEFWLVWVVDAQHPDPGRARVSSIRNTIEKPGRPGS
jgi:hypothetical protein